MERDRIIRVSDNLKKEIANFIQASDLKDSCGDNVMTVRIAFFKELKKRYLNIM